MAVALDSAKSVHQTLLVNLLESIFSGEQILVNSKKHASLKYPGTGAYMEFDVCVPSTALCFEFQDAYHYVTTWYSHSAQSHIREKDYMKKQMARSNGMTLVTVPCWWDGNVHSLFSTMVFHYPSISRPAESTLVGVGVGVGADPIALNPPAGLLNPPEIPTVGELMLASFPTDHDFSLSIDADDNWWMGEKYDGIRCCWHPEHNVMYSRQRRVFTLHPQILASLTYFHHHHHHSHDHNHTREFIDGELWFGRGNFVHSYSMVKAVVDAVQWHILRMISFDNPAVCYQHLPFEVRYQSLLHSLPADHPFGIVVARVLCTHMSLISQAVQSILEGEGEGVILRKRASIYEHGRTANLVKLKAAQDDQEGIVVAIGIAGDQSVEIKLPNGKCFTVPRTQVAVPELNVGDVVSFTYDRSARRDLPLHAVIYRVRTDLEWEDVVDNSLSIGTTEPRLLNDSSAVPGFTSHPLYHWNTKNMREFLINFAKNRNLDPLSPETWYNLSSSAIRELKGGNSILSKFGGYFETVDALFPDLSLDIATYKQYMWDEEDKRRQYFETYAFVNEFDPLIPDNWYAQPKDKIMSYKGSTDVLSYHNRSISEALMALFPDIGLRKDMFYWPMWVHSVAKTFFESYASENNFDPLSAGAWYDEPVDSILDHKGAKVALLPYNGSVRKALASVFPEIGFDKSRFAAATYSAPSNRRQFFEEYARANNFNPTVSSNWYGVSFSNIMAIEGATKVMSYHSNSVARALLELFPEIGLVKAKFYYKSIWSYPRNRRDFFIDYAKQNGFDHKDINKWYIQSKEKILNFKGASRILCYHGNSISKALVDLFPNLGFDKSKFILTPQWQDVQNRKSFFESYARDNRFDPLQPDQWYGRLDDLLVMKGIKKLLFYHGDSLPKALMELYPNIGFEKKKFSARYRHDELEHRRMFFAMYARDHAFDPLVAANWYSQPRSKIMSAQGATKVLAFYCNSISKALVDVFPDIGLDENQFLIREMNHTVNRRKFFESFALRHSFDPYVADNWYLVSKDAILSTQGIELLLPYHKNSIKRALLDLFPSIGLDASKFSFKASQWNEISARRSFFNKYAAANGFDLKYAANWYSQSRTKMVAFKGASRVMTYHNNNIFQALYDLFPDIGLDPVKLRLPIQHRHTARDFFTKYAHYHHFDPLNAENWYLQSIQQISNSQVAKQVLGAYNNDMRLALLHAFPDINLELSQFKVSPSKWNLYENRQKYFESIARQHGIDPLIPHHWYTFDKNILMQSKSIASILSFHNSSIPKALCDLFPDIGLKRHLFQQPQLMWAKPKNRRSFFVSYAQAHGFDYVNPDNWYQQSIDLILAAPGGKKVISYHCECVEQALVDLFPDINFDASKFNLVS